MFKDSDFFCFKYVLSKIYDKGVISKKLKIDAYIQNDDQATLDKAEKFFGKPKEIDLNINKVQYVQVPSTEGVKCWECASELKYPFYWLRWEEGNKFGCRKCI